MARSRNFSEGILRKRKDRINLNKSREPKLGYYLIVTDTNSTEKNYLYGVRDSIAKIFKDYIVIKVMKTHTNNLVEKCKEIRSMEPQYRKLWIVFDRDLVNSFDEIIHEAESIGIKVGWSNPCIEIWFNAYFGSMPISLNSIKCNEKFEKKFEEKTGEEYKKSAEDNYKKLLKYGNEEEAILIAEKRLNEQSINCIIKPSEMLATTTLHELIKEIRKAPMS